MVAYIHVEKITWNIKYDTEFKSILDPEKSKFEKRQNPEKNLHVRKRVPPI